MEVQSTHHDSCDVTTLKLLNRHIHGLQQVGPQALRNQSVEVDGAAEELHMALPQDGLIAVWTWVWELACRLCPESLIQTDAAGRSVWGGGKGKQ